MSQDTIAPLRHFVIEMTRWVDLTQEESTLLKEGRKLLSPLLSEDTWLPEAFAQPHPDHYVQYLLHCDPLERFSVVSFVWGPGHRTPVHDHTVWGLVGVLRGAERCEEFEWRAQPGSKSPDQGHPVDRGRQHLMHPGDIEAVSPTLGDWHRVSNALDEGVSISIHVYGGNIGAVTRHRLDAQGQVVDFVSGYTASVTPNLWDRSARSALPKAPR